jgi:coproporphyrinogen III oxidase-like Fe-S oxidoreductase
MSFFLYSDSGALLFFSHQKSIKEFVSRYSSSLAMLSIMFHIFFLPAIVVYCSVDSVTKHMCHPFWTDMSYICHAFEI